MGLFFGQNRISENTPVVSNIKYGRLYNPYVVVDPLIAPIGWHVPTYAELLTLFIGVSDLLTIMDNNYWTPEPFSGNELLFNLRGTGVANANEGEFGFESIGSYAYLGAQPSIDTSISLVIVQYDIWDTESWVWNIIKQTSTSFGNYQIFGVPLRFIKDDSTLVSSVTDLDGNIYRTCKIGEQVWLADNWACTKLRNGTPIPNITDGAAWCALTTGAYCNYGNDQANVFL